jgi:hypothetical protein
MTNSILYAAKKEHLIPVWYYENVYRREHSWHKQLWYSIDGRPGYPVLLWLSNNNETTNFQIHLNASFYNIDPAGWIAIDISSGTVVAKGSGTDIFINTTVPEKSWKPIYIANVSASHGSIYSNIFLESQLSEGATSTYVLNGPQKQISWLIINSRNLTLSVSANNTGLLSEQSLEALFSNSDLLGWHYDPANEILYVKFYPTSAVVITVQWGAEIPEFNIPILLLAVFTSSIAVIYTAKKRRYLRRDHKDMKRLPSLFKTQSIKR